MEYLREVIDKLKMLPELFGELMPLPVKIIIGAVILALITLAAKRIFF